MSDWEEFMRSQPAFRRSFYLHIGAILMLIGVMVVAVFLADGAFTFWWWIGMVAFFDNVWLHLRVQAMLDERTRKLREFTRKFDERGGKMRDGDEGE